MYSEIIKLKEENEAITLKTFITDEGGEMMHSPRPAMIVIPGGAYYWWADREGEPVVKKFFAAGFNCFILHYTVMPHCEFPVPLQDASRAIIHVRENAEKYNIDPDKIFVCGFSAGGHVAASIGTMWHLDMAKPWDDMPYGLNKPNGMILCYPVITLTEPHGHFDCSNNICKGDVTPEKIEAYSCEKQVSENTAPAYIWTTFNDDCVDAENSLMMAWEMSRHKIPYELHIFRHGPHGLATADEDTCIPGTREFDLNIASWVDEAIEWTKKI